MSDKDITHLHYLIQFFFLCKFNLLEYIFLYVLSLNAFPFMNLGKCEYLRSFVTFPYQLLYVIFLEISQRNYLICDKIIYRFAQ